MIPHDATHSFEMYIVHTFLQKDEDKCKELIQALSKQQRKSFLERIGTDPGLELLQPLIKETL